MAQAKDFLPDVSGFLSRFEPGDFHPTFGIPVDFSKLTPSQKLSPSFGAIKPSGVYAPSFGGGFKAPSGTGIPLSFTNKEFFAPSFGAPPGSNDFGLPGVGKFSTFDDILRQYQRGQYKPVVPVGQTGGGVIADLGDHPLNAYDNDFVQAGQAFVFDPLILKALAYVEHGWDQPVSPAGAVGIMQLMPNWETELGHPVDRTDPHQNIMAGAEVLRQKFNEGNGTLEDAIRRYHGYGDDGYTNDTEYLNLVMDWYHKLQQAAPKNAGGQPYTGSKSGLAAVFGGQSFGISQEIGGHAMDYSYGIELGVGNSHPGIDIAAPAGTTAYFPGIQLTGTVVAAGGTGYFCYYSSCGQGVGELRIQLSNGDILIYGHMQNIAVGVGQTVNAGTFLGRTGGAGSGDHLHFEYRQKCGSTSSGYCAVDPRNLVGY